MLRVDGVTQRTTRIGIRPERVGLAGASAHDNHVPVTVQSSAYLGSFVDVVLNGPGQQRLSCQVPNTATLSSAETFTVGLALTMSFKASDCVVFDQENNA